MRLNYDIEKINSFLSDFCSITGLTVSIWDAEMNQLTHQPTIIPDFCRLIKNSSHGAKRCLMSDREVCLKCRNTLSPITHHCHAGLVDTVVPIILDGRLFGFMMFGQIQGNQDNQLTKEHFINLGEELSLSPDELFNAYHSLNTFDMNRVISASKILIAAAGYLFDSGAIQYTEHELINGINEYVTRNISQTISVAEICAYFGISKNRLYSLWSTYFNTTIGQYIQKKRMEAARDLLLYSDQKINIISIEVGIPDYNYFTKVFKKYYGIPPKDFRRHKDNLS